MLVLADPTADKEALAILRRQLAAIDAAASRFRTDSELSRLNAAAGRPVSVSALMLEAVEVALRAARVTGGVVDPTAAEALQSDRLRSGLRGGGAAGGPGIRVDFQPVPGWHRVRVDRGDGHRAAAARGRPGPGRHRQSALRGPRRRGRHRRHRGCRCAGQPGGRPRRGRAALRRRAGSVRITHDHADPPERGGPTVSGPVRRAGHFEHIGTPLGPRGSNPASFDRPRHRKPPRRTTGGR